jgi:membrane associated rhomboid family serine protease
MKAVPLRMVRSREKIDEWTLVLASSSIPYEVGRIKGEWLIYVHPADLERAEETLRHYEEENRYFASELRGELPSSKKELSGFFVSVFILSLFIILKLTGYETALFQTGSASSEHIMEGEVWRAVTALFLHGDFLHVLSNALFCWIFCSVVVRLYGPGLGWFLILLAGTLGNLLTAVLYRTGHVSIGASTALFGALGMLGAWRFVLRRKHPLFRRKAWVPAAGVVALFAFLGTGKNVDFVAHIAGAVTGCVLGWITANFLAQNLSKRLQNIFVFLTIGIIILAWMPAFIAYPA